MNLRITILSVCAVWLISCSDNSSTNQQAQGVEQTQQIEEVQQTESTTQTSTEAALDIQYDAVTRYLKKGYKPFSENYYQSMDFDNNGTKDFVLAVYKGESEAYQNEPVTLQIYKQLDNKQFELAAQSGPVQEILFAEQGEIGLEKNVISIKSGLMRSNHEWKFRYDKAYNDYVLIGSEYNSYGNATGDGSGNRSTNYLTGKRISKFNSWDEEKEVLNALPVEKINVPSTKVNPKFFKDFNNDRYDW